MRTPNDAKFGIVAVTNESSLASKLAQEPPFVALREDSETIGSHNRKLSSLRFRDATYSKTSDLVQTSPVV